MISSWELKEGPNEDLRFILDHTYRVLTLMTLTVMPFQPSRLANRNLPSFIPYRQAVHRLTLDHRLMAFSVIKITSA